MLDPVRFCPDNSHPLSQMSTVAAAAWDLGRGSLPRAADAWVACASHSSLEWSYLYVPQEVFA